VLREQRGGCDELTWRADAALEPAVADERILERRERLSVREALDGRDRVAVDEHGRQQAGGEELSTDKNAARAADSDGAALFGPGQPEVIAQHVDEAPIRANLERLR
jgi:hypothetical protein